MEDGIVAVVSVALLFGGPAICVVFCRACKLIDSLGRAHMESKLKTTMIERGYSVQEIERLCSMPVDPEAVEYARRYCDAARAVGPQKPVKA
jgi:hypothetical protein